MIGWSLRFLLISSRGVTAKRLPSTRKIRTKLRLNPPLVVLFLKAFKNLNIPKWESSIAARGRKQISFHVKLKIFKLKNKKREIVLGLIENKIKTRRIICRQKNSLLFFSCQISAVVCSRTGEKKARRILLRSATQKRGGEESFITSWLAFSDRNSPKTFSALLIASFLRCCGKAGLSAHGANELSHPHSFVKLRRLNEISTKEAPEESSLMIVYLKTFVAAQIKISSEGRVNDFELRCIKLFFNHKDLMDFLQMLFSFPNFREAFPTVVTGQLRLVPLPFLAIMYVVDVCCDIVPVEEKFAANFASVVSLSSMWFLETRLFN